MNTHIKNRNIGSRTANPTFKRESFPNWEVIMENQLFPMKYVARKPARTNPSFTKLDITPTLLTKGIN